MKPGRFDLDLYRGDTYQWRFLLWEDDAQTVPFDLADRTVAAEIRDRPGGHKITSLACVVALPNQVDVTLNADDCGLLPTKGAWDLQLTEPGPPDVVRTVIAGSVQVTGDVTESSRWPVEPVAVLV